MRLAALLSLMSLTYAYAEPGNDGVIVNIEPNYSTPLKAESTVEQAHFWAYSDMIMGAMVGAYVPLNKYAR